MKSVLVLVTLVACTVAVYAVLRPIHQAETLRVKEIIIVDGDGPEAHVRPAGITFTDANGRATMIAAGAISVREGERIRRIEISGDHVDAYEGSKP